MPGGALPGGAVGQGGASTVIPSPAAVPTPAASGAKSLRLHASADSWVEVSDSDGRALVARLVKAGEQVELEGTAPLRLKIGNASATEVIFRGQPVALAPHTRNNLARFELN